MPKEFSRSQRLGEQIRRELSTLVQNEVKDPRVAMVSFTAIKLSRDLSHATVYCSVLNQQERVETIEALNRASGFLRKKLAAEINARIVPALKFIYDESLERGAHLTNLINAARKDDAEKGLIDDDSPE
ncbi:MAG: 30S ribosome-binding factor RbfA [Gammaproteobacteria bacterium]|nr:30S ribosome-binding factor RbfA [Gammaproteobacteria bacterium]